MKVSIMQPYFFPYLGYWQLYYNCDHWVFLNEVQFNRRSWMSRNRILHDNPDSEFQYINVPVTKHSRGTSIDEICIDESQQWTSRITGQLSVYRRLRAPFYNDVIRLVEKIIASENKSLFRLILNMVNDINSYVGLETPYSVSSELQFDRSEITAADDWALAICRQLGADEYINPSGGVALFNLQKYRNAGIRIRFMKPLLSEYSQSRRQYQPGLSIIDVLMFNSVTRVRQMLEKDFEYI